MSQLFMEQTSSSMVESMTYKRSSQTWTSIVFKISVGETLKLKAKSLHSHMQQHVAYSTKIDLVTSNTVLTRTISLNQTGDSVRIISSKKVSMSMVASWTMAKSMSIFTFLNLERNHDGYDLSVKENLLWKDTSIVWSGWRKLTVWLFKVGGIRYFPRLKSGKLICTSWQTCICSRLTS